MPDIAKASRLDRAVAAVFVPLACLGMFLIAGAMLSASGSAPAVIHGWLGLGLVSETEEYLALGGFVAFCGLSAGFLGLAHPVVAHPDPDAVDPRLSRLMDVLHVGFILNGATMWLVGGFARLFLQA